MGDQTGCRPPWTKAAPSHPLVDSGSGSRAECHVQAVGIVTQRLASRLARFRVPMRAVVSWEAVATSRLSGEKATPSSRSPCWSNGVRGSAVCISQTRAELPDQAAVTKLLPFGEALMR